MDGQNPEAVGVVQSPEPAVTAVRETHMATPQQKQVVILGDILIEMPGTSHEHRTTQLASIGGVTQKVALTTYTYYGAKDLAFQVQTAEYPRGQRNIREALSGAVDDGLEGIRRAPGVTSVHVLHQRPKSLGAIDGIEFVAAAEPSMTAMGWILLEPPRRYMIVAVARNAQPDDARITAFFHSVQLVRKFRARRREQSPA
jgi:hypothetical protein